ncbi:hypothetical protein GCM10011571_33610 [Marinithermofilum abyssi]|uniref:Uncharacterized protein n=1 Tax=Marinithermofilum abyssi TaxID=1571185 RepID=A0A8J2VFS3_9BACL|nr:hypothetical protein [Marinithermofilum abyssi]GGE28764.1 hypothetical protein GCM10011571_33610 [Marinithermofilum abyssi]
MDQNELYEAIRRYREILSKPKEEYTDDDLDFMWNTIQNPTFQTFLDSLDGKRE